MAKVPVTVVSDTASFSRMATPEGEIMLVKLNTQFKSATGVTSEHIQTFVLHGEQANEVISTIKLVCGRIDQILTAANAHAAAEASKVENAPDKPTGPAADAST